MKQKKECFCTLSLHTNHLNLGAYSKIKTHFYKNFHLGGNERTQSLLHCKDSNYF